MIRAAKELQLDGIIAKRKESSTNRAAVVALGEI
jgi:hypothetical protein